MPCKEYHTINMYQDILISSLCLQFNQFNLVYCFLQWQSFRSHPHAFTHMKRVYTEAEITIYMCLLKGKASALLSHQGYFVLFILVLLKFTERSYLYNLNPKEMSLSKKSQITIMAVSMRICHHTDHHGKQDGLSLWFL